MVEEQRPEKKKRHPNFLKWQEKYLKDTPADRFSMIANDAWAKLG